MKLTERKGFTIEKEIITETDTLTEFRLKLTNATEQDQWLSEVCLYEADSLEQLGIGGACRLFRSGRHKNDMPSVCTLGVLDDSMRDAMGAMTETGDKAEAGSGQHSIVSDHLTILGNENGYTVIAFMTGRDQLFSTEVKVDDGGNFVKLCAKTEFHIRVKPGQTVLTELLRIERTTDVQASIRRFAMDKAGRYGCRNQRSLSVFCTWYYYGLSVSYEDVRGNLKRMQEERLPFQVFQVDEGWEITLGEWQPNEKFPVPMKQVAEEIRAAGYIPGIWTSPFVAHETAGVWKSHPEWILRDKTGNPCLFPMNDTVYYVFDITVPATCEYFYELYRRLTFDWGYPYHKLDFTRAAVIYPDAAYSDDTVTLAQAYFRAVSAIRRGMGEDSYFLMCGGLYDPLIGLVDAQRTGSDVLSMWSSPINKDGKTAPYTIKQSILRYYMNYWWNNDPDALMVRKNETMERGLRLTYGLLNDEEVKTSVLNQLIGGGIICSTEPLDRITPDRLYQLRHILPNQKPCAEPLDLMSCGRFPESVRLTAEADPDSCYLVRINWSDTEEMPLAVTVDSRLLGQAGAEDRFAVSEFYSQKMIPDAAFGERVEFPALKPHGATIIKITRRNGQPIVSMSDGHFLMGAETEELTIEDGMLRLRAANLFAVPIQYQISLPEGFLTADGQRSLPVTIAPYAQECFCYPLQRLSYPAVTEPER